MNPGLLRASCAIVAFTSLLFTGCLFQPATVSTRHFILTSMSTNGPAPAASERLSVGIRSIRMPSYLLRDSMAIRDGVSEIRYLDNAVWGERLDRSLQRTLAANLSRLLSSDSVYPADWVQDHVTLRVFVDVQRFDVDTRGNGTLIADWLITAADTDKEVKRGRAQLVRVGADPRGRPEVIAAALSGLADELSRALAQPIRESLTPGRSPNP